MKSENTNINLLSEKQKVNYVKNLLFNSDINEVLNILLKDEKKDLNIIKIIISVLDEKLILDRIKEQYNSSCDAKIYVYSRILSVLSFYNKSIIISNFLKSLKEDELRKLAIYEYKNKTDVSFNNKAFNKICFKYKSELIDEDHTEVLEFDEKPILVKKKKKKVLKPVLLAIFIIFILVSGYIYYDCKKLINGYKDLFYPGIHLNDIDLSGKMETELNEIIQNEKEKILKGTITVTNPNEDYKLTYEEINITVNEDDVLDEIKDYNNNLSFLDKVKKIKGKGKDKTFYLKGEFSKSSVDAFMNMLEQKLNTSARNDGIIVDENHNVRYDKGANGFTLDKEKTMDKVKEAFANLKEETVIEAEGKVVKNEIKYEYLKDINKKISSYTTYFLNSGNRGHNIVLASSRLNNTVVMPGDTFSYLKVVGPYGASNGYLPAPIYLNSEVSTANGGGVCQLASTTYMAQLKAGLETVSRRNHTFAPTYVPKGLDSTVYSTTTDYKFKNQYKYPIYIVSYVKGNYLTVDMWSNENELEGKTYEPYSVPSNGGWLAYLNTIKDGKVIETKYLDRSVYKTH